MFCWADGTELKRGYEVLFYLHGWLWTLAAPRVYATLKRFPSPDLLIEIVDGYLAFPDAGAAAPNEPHMVTRLDPAERRRRIIAFRNIVAQWEPPTLTNELMFAARTLFEDEYGPGRDWEKEVADPAGLPEECNLWPEGVPRLLKERAEKAHADIL